MKELLSHRVLPSTIFGFLIVLSAANSHSCVSVMRITAVARATCSTDSSSGENKVVGLEVKVYDNGDHTSLVWLPSDGQSIPNCRGFAIHKTLRASAGANAIESYVGELVGFSDDEKFDPSAPWKFPIQRFMWWDYLVQPGNVVQYSIVPVVGPDKDHLQPFLPDASAQTPPMTVSGQASTHISAYFNKGIVSAQWVSRALKAISPNAKLSDLIAQTNNSLRNALSGLLRPQLLQLLDDVRKNDGEIYAALYELNDPELIPALVALGQKCHLILANGAFKPPDNDENIKVRAQLRGKIDLHDRKVGKGHFAHNKFLVACNSAGNPRRVLSGSTNWTVTGLCTQANNGVIVDDPKIWEHSSLRNGICSRLPGTTIPRPSCRRIRRGRRSMSTVARSRNGSRPPTRVRIWTMRVS